MTSIYDQYLQSTYDEVKLITAASGTFYAVVRGAGLRRIAAVAADDVASEALGPAASLRGAVARAPARAVAPAKRSTGTTVLGNGPDYERIADEAGHRRFFIPPHIVERMRDGELTAANRTFLDRTVLRGDRIELATHPAEARDPSVYLDELGYLIEVRKNFRISEDGTHLIRLDD